MIFSRIVGSVSRSARSRFHSNRYSGFGHGSILSVTESCLEAKPCVYGCLGFSKAYLPSNGGVGAGAGNQIVYGKLFENNGSVLAIPTNRRLFSTESPENRNDDIIYANDTMKIPKSQEQKSESNGDSNTGHTHSKVHFDDVAFGSIALGMFFISAYVNKLLFMHFHEQKQISFEEFINLLREHGLVDHIEVVNGSIANVCVSSFPRKTGQKNDDVSPHYEKSTTGGIRQYKHYFKVDSEIKEFEEKLEKAQASLGIDPHDYVPLVYSRNDGILYRFLFC